MKKYSSLGAGVTLYCSLLRLCICSLSLLLPVTAGAGFFEMPEITELPQLERKSLLKDLDIPGVRDRDPNPESGPRLNITRFKLEGIVEYPKLGINKADIESLIEEIRFDLMEEFNVLESGFTKAEVDDVSKLLVEIEEETVDRHVTELEVQRLVWLVRKQRSSRGVTLGQIETVADRITQFYRQRGFILAKAYIPRQEVRDGVVTLTLLLGSLGEVEVLNNEVYDDDTLAAVFDDWYTSPVTNAIVEENLYLINDYPGVSVTGFFEPGDQVGDTRLNLNVQNEQRYEFNLRVDNHGSEQTGAFRLYSEVKVNNLLGNADQIHVAGLYAFEPENTSYHQLRYSSRVFSPRLDIAIGASNNDFELGPGNSESINNLDLSGKTEQADITATYRYNRSRTNSYYGIVKFEEIESILRLGAFPDLDDVGLDDIVINTTLTFSYDILDEESTILHQGDFSFLSGSFDKGVDPGQDEDYTIFTANYSLLTFWQPSFVESRTSIVYRASLQYTDSALSSINQYALAGPTRVRAYDSNQFSADRAVYTGVEWVLGAPDFFDWEIGDSNFGNIAKPFVFLDVSWGEAFSLVEGLSGVTGQLLGTGIGLQFSYENVLQGRFQLAAPLGADFNTDDIEAPDDNYKLVFDVQYSFR
ncbi:MAG: ShlB/FhaC/HecB family hemolysin secretion/activation protein [Gammaproteobacteria bacterium]|nr:ShlB/FhaC/HecB family hemolysin secretion/activation protein [Gammaproteobacteria bacterium]